ncbi:MAG TPA: hypothetical protein VKG80_18390 [Trebonia sp.]|nr:hypothetical protein [Trebonia sp.]
MRLLLARPQAPARGRRANGWRPGSASPQPTKRNAFNPAMPEQPAVACYELEADDDLRCGVLPPAASTSRPGWTWRR